MGLHGQEAVITRLMGFIAITPRQAVTTKAAIAGVVPLGKGTISVGSRMAICRVLRNTAVPEKLSPSLIPVAGAWFLADNQSPLPAMIIFPG